jgi:alanyl-tRNA synthetase
VVGEAGVAAGVRRIEALTGAAARHHLAQQEKRLKAVALALKVSPDEAAERVATLVEERRRLERELAEARKKLALGGGGDGANPVIEVGGVKFYRMAVSGLEMNDLKALADQGKASVGSGVVAIANTSGEGKASLVVGVTGDLTSRFNAIELVRKGAAAVGGKGGGGRPDLAQAGGPEGDKAGAALDAVEAALRG